MEKDNIMINENAKKELADLGFSIDGHDRVESLINHPEKMSQVPAAGGVYAVITPDSAMPEFIMWQYGNYYKKKDKKTGIENIKPLMYSIAVLEDSWISDTSIIYFGKADDLHKRINDYIRYYNKLQECQHTHEQLNKVAHRGGRSIWQIKGAENLIIAWMLTPNETPKLVEAGLIKTFKEKHGCRPFANKAE